MTKIIRFAVSLIASILVNGGLIYLLLFHQKYQQQSPAHNVYLDLVPETELISLNKSRHGPHHPQNESKQKTVETNAPQTSNLSPNVITEQATATDIRPKAMTDALLPSPPSNFTHQSAPPNSAEGKSQLPHKMTEPSDHLEKLSKNNQSAIANYMGLLRQHIERYKTYPIQAKKRRIEGEVTIVFVMNRNGQVLSKQIIKSSGNDDLDKAALDMVEDALPLPPPPPEIEGATIRIPFTVTFNLKY